MGVRRVLIAAATAGRARRAASSTASARRVEHVFGSDDLTGRSVLIQGVGAVGANLAARARGGRRARARRATSTRRAPRRPASRPSRPTPCFGCEVDVFAPCAVGAVLNAETIPLLNCRAVAGAANNQLAEPSDAELLQERGILFAPDYVVNSGGVIYLIALVDEGRDADGIEAGLAGIADTLRGLFAKRTPTASRPAKPRTAWFSGVSRLDAQ